MRSAVKLTVKRSNILPSTEHDDETFGADAFALQGSTSTDILSFVFLVV
ncbi:MAG: hypothetical protein HW419_1474 [Deltaproteobacteria bacterium]|nr:hypothetical protein [Deltaproteobacteria bacterium]